jgi:hemerythrin-like domain-containing protein
MCEYCGCQALEAIAELTREHDRALVLVRDAEQALLRRDVASAAAACVRLTDVLAPHTAVEERALFPALEPDFPSQIAALHTEHRQIEAALAEASGAAPPDGWEARLLAALTVLRNHIRKEEDGVFPAALGILTPTQWDALATVRAVPVLTTPQ